MGLGDEHIMEEHREELASLLTSCLGGRAELRDVLVAGESEREDWLEDERRKEHVEELPGCVHLVALPDNACQDLENLFGLEVVLKVLRQA